MSALHLCARVARTYIVCRPNQAGQSDISPSDAAGLWQSLIQPLHELGMRLGSPAPTSAPDGKTWLQSFLGNCTGCTVDFIALRAFSRAVLP
jgi:hypothetical protein